MKYFVIGSGVDADYSTVAALHAVMYTGVLLNDSDAPYVVLFQNDQLHRFEPLLQNYDMTGTGLYISATDASHYYIFQPQGKKWQGEVDPTGCATLYYPYSDDWGDSGLPYYSYMSNLVITTTGDVVSADSISMFTSNNSKVHDCLFKNLYFKYTDDKGGNINIGSIWSVDQISNKIYNCVFDTIGVTATGLDTNIECMLRINSLTNCVVDNISFSLGTKGSGVFILSDSYNTLTILDDFNGVRRRVNIFQSPNCAATSGNVNLATSLLYPYDITNHFESGYYYSSENAMGRGSGIYPNYNPGSINGVEYWPYTQYDIGPLYFKKNILCLQQNNQSLIFRVK